MRQVTQLFQTDNITFLCDLALFRVDSYITCLKQLCHLPHTVMSHRKRLYHPFAYLFCILSRSGSRSNDPVAKQSKQEEWNFKTKWRIRYSVRFKSWWEITQFKDVNTEEVWLLNACILFNRRYFHCQTRCCYNIA